MRCRKAKKNRIVCIIRTTKYCAQTPTHTDSLSFPRSLFLFLLLCKSQHTMAGKAKQRRAHQVSSEQTDENRKGETVTGSFVSSRGFVSYVRLLDRKLELFIATVQYVNNFFSPLAFLCFPVLTPIFFLFLSFIHFSCFFLFLNTFFIFPTHLKKTTLPFFSRVFLTLWISSNSIFKLFVQLLYSFFFQFSLCFPNMFSLPVRSSSSFTLPNAFFSSSFSLF
ncbi:unnamed protein product [Acanthosepion pharaonis]|uniref:Transmembrane protein n=1 Tax=Acanthosepion pharaonis TaxID=158019 RepID=A0A812BXR2_ACAPH|nr:unnamed protein product [Sepia pharaonis]